MPKATSNTQTNLRSKTTILHVFKLLKPHKAITAIVITIGIMSSGLGLLQPMYVNYLLNAVEQNRNITRIIVILALVFVTAIVLDGVVSNMANRLAAKIILNKRSHLIMCILGLPIREYDKRESGDYISTVVSDTNELRSVLSPDFFKMGAFSVTALGSATAMLLIDTRLFALSLVASCITILLMFVVSSRLQTYAERVQAKLAGLSNAVLRSLAGIRTIKAFRATVPETKRAIGCAEEVYQATIKVANREAVIRAIVNCSMQLTLLIVFAFGGTEIAKGELNISSFISFSMYLTMVISSLSSISSSITTSFKSLGALSRIEHIESFATRSEISSVQTVVPHVELSLAKDSLLTIEFKDVSFSYADSNNNGTGGDTLQNISFSAAPQQNTVIVGSSGSGKTTILSLIEAFYGPDSGHILYNDVDSTVLNVDDIRKMVGYVEQDAPIFSGSIRDNLTMGTTVVSDETCWDVLKLVQLDAKVDRLENRLDTQVGEQGHFLSGGERQRLSIARILLHKKPVILLDEPTSSLDPINQQKIHTLLRQAFNKQTVIEIVHRMSTIEPEDHIIVLEKGKIVAIGTHEDLKSSSSAYRELLQTSTDSRISS
jgi:ABC-type multidrug transport system fused ATPase/permease subunit